MNNKIEKKESGISLAEMEERINRLPLTYEDLARVRANLQANIPEYDDLLQFAAIMVIAIVKTKVHGTGDALKTLVKASNQLITVLHAGAMFQKTTHAKSAASKRLAKDPKHIALKAIEVKFLASSYPFDIRGYKAKFAKEMLGEYPVIEDIKSINRLVTKLSKDRASAS